MSTLTESQPALLQQRSFVAYWCARTATNGAYHMQAVAAGWQIYELTGSAFDLGLVGLVQFFPVVVLGVVIGHMADRYDRRVVVGTCQVVKALAAAAFAIGTIGGFLTRDAMLAILFVSGTARAFETPTMHTLVPGGGPPEKKPVTMETLFAGFRYILHNKVVLGAVSLDLFAMLLGGVTALLPVYAKDVLMTEQWGLGLLRSAPAVGALIVSAWLAHHQIERRTGHVLFAAVAIFGLATMVFAFSTSLALSMAALAIYGACDAVSVVIRHSLVQTRTPNEMLGRVLAVNFMFTGTSGTLGEFRAGAAAAGFGGFAAVLAGGIGAIVIALLWMRLFPEIARIDKIQA